MEPVSDFCHVFNLILRAECFLDLIVREIFIDLLCAFCRCVTELVTLIRCSFRHVCFGRLLERGPVLETRRVTEGAIWQKRESGIAGCSSSGSRDSDSMRYEGACDKTHWLRSQYMAVSLYLCVNSFTLGSQVVTSTDRTTQTTADSRPHHDGQPTSNTNRGHRYRCFRCKIWGSPWLPLQHAIYIHSPGFGNVVPG